MRFCCSSMLALAIAAACARPDSGATPGDSVAAPSSTDVGATRLATDGTLVLLVRADLAPALRLAATAFARREGLVVRVDTTTTPVGDSASADRASQADLFVGTQGAVEALQRRSGASWWMRFAENRIVLAWRDSLPRGLALDSVSWWRQVVRSRARVGRTDPAQSMLGRRALLTMQLTERVTGERRLAARLAQRSAARDIFPADDSLGAALEGGRISIAWSYESTARTAGWRYTRLGDAVDLGDPALADSYALASITLPAADTARRDSTVVRGAPISYALTIPRRAGNPAMAERLVRFLFLGDGRALLASGPYTVTDSVALFGVDVPTTVLALPHVRAQAHGAARTDSAS